MLLENAALFTIFIDNHHEAPLITNYEVSQPWKRNVFLFPLGSVIAIMLYNKTKSHKISDGSGQGWPRVAGFVYVCYTHLSLLLCLWHACIQDMLFSW